MSRMPSLMRHSRNVAHRDPAGRALEDAIFALFARDPVFRDPAKLMKRATAPKQEHHGIKGIYSDSEVKVDDKKVEVHLDVHTFTPGQIHVKTVGNEILIEGKKDAKREDDWTLSHFERRFRLPEGFPTEKVECHLDKGKLMLVAFKAEPLQERTIPIQEKGATKGEKAK